MKKRLIVLLLCILITSQLMVLPASAATNSFDKTDNIAQNMINAALAQVGKKNADFDGMPADNWCAYFIDWLSMNSGAGAAGILPNKYSGYGTTRSVAQFAVNKGGGTAVCFPDISYNYLVDFCGTSRVSQGSRSSFVPQPGDLIFFLWNGSTASFASHVALVYDVVGSTVYYVDGNGSAVSGDEAFYKRSYVNTHSISKTSTEISAYVRPNYGSSSGGSVVPDSGVSIYGTNVTNLTSTSVRLNGGCSYTGSRPSSVGVYFGTSMSNMTKKDYDTINHTKNPFDIWYDISGLQPNTTYFWQLYAVVDGETCWANNILSFTTSPDPSAVSVLKTTNCRYYVTIPANYRLQGYQYPTSTANYRYIAAQDAAYTLNCTKKVELSDGNVRYFFTDASGNGIYFVYTSGMSVQIIHNYSSEGVESDHPHCAYKRCDCGAIKYTDNGSYHADCDICNPPVTGIRLPIDSISLTAGNAMQLSAEIVPSNATNQAVIWSSDNPAVATVDQDGFVVAVSSGTATITAETVDGGYRASCTITVISGMTFLDVPADSYYADAVEWAVNQGITTGYGSSSIFAPDGTCTRGQVVTFLWRAAGKPEPATLMNPFQDVDSDDFYYKAVLWAIEEGITAGYGSSTVFAPDGACTRGQVATFLHRYYGTPAAASLENPFEDIAEGAYYYDAVLWAVEEGITNGYGSDTVFAPEQTCTRSQIVTFLYRAMN